MPVKGGRFHSLIVQRITDKQTRLFYSVRDHQSRIMKSLSLTQIEAGAILGIKQPHVSALKRNRSGNFSVERLMEFLLLLGQDVEFTVRLTKNTVRYRLSLLEFSGSYGWRGLTIQK